MVAVKENINSIRRKIKKTKSGEVELDLSSMNVFDAARAAVLSSAFYYRKNPDSKIKCKLQSESVKSFISTLSVKNLEFV